MKIAQIGVTPLLTSNLIKYIIAFKQLGHGGVGFSPY
jgi:hypothetical protein